MNDRDQPDWANMNGADAYCYIERHAENWTETEQMMEAWLAAQIRVRRPPLRLVPDEPEQH